MTDQEQIEAIAELLPERFGIYSESRDCYIILNPGAVIEECDPLTDLNACKELIEAMRKEGFVCSLVSGFSGAWECCFHNRDFNPIGRVIEPTIERAICRAFLEFHQKWKD